jgi:type I restriction enzyme S subunit
MWKTEKLEVLCNVSIGKTPSRSNPRLWDKEKNSENVWISIADLSSIDEKYIGDSKEYVSDCGAKLFKSVPKNTLVMSFKLSIGKLAITSRELRTNEAIAALLIKNENLILKEYLYYYLSSLNWNAIAGDVVKVKGKTLNKAKLKELPINFPHLVEQQRIVANLDATFSEIDKALDIKESNSRSLKYLLGRYIDGELRKLTNTLPPCRLGDMIDGVEYGTSTKCAKDGRYPVLRMGNMQGGKFSFDNLVYLNDECEAKKYRVKSGEVFFNRTNSPVHVGKSAYFENDNPNFSFAGYLIRVKFSEDTINGKFLNYYLNSPSTRRYGYSVMTSSVNQANINGTKLKDYPFIKIGLRKQVELSGKFEQMESRIDEAHEVMEAQLHHYLALKSAVLAQELRRK